MNQKYNQIKYFNYIINSKVNVIKVVKLVIKFKNYAFNVKIIKF